MRFLFASFLACTFANGVALAASFEAEGQIVSGSEFLCSEWVTVDGEFRYEGTMFIGRSFEDKLVIKNKHKTEQALRYLGDYNDTGAKIYITNNSGKHVSLYFLLSPSSKADIKIQSASFATPMTVETRCNISK